MKKIIFAALTAVVFSCAIGFANAYTHSDSKAATRAAVSAKCGCDDCACEVCECTDCSTGSCDAGCSNSGSDCCAK